MDVSIIIVNYNTALLLKNCLHSIIEKTIDLDYEIIVVDNASTDDSVVMIELNFDKVKLIKSDENIGFGRANNKGAKYADGKYFFFLNSDTLLINNAIKILFDFMENDANLNVGACCGNLYKQDLSPNYSYSLNLPSLLSIFKYRAHLRIKDENFNHTNVNKDIINVIGADLFIKKKLYDLLDGFDPKFFMYVEDSEFSYRINKTKYKIVSIPNAKIIHLQGKSSTNTFKIRMEIDGYLYYFHKHYNDLTVLSYLSLELFFCLLRMMVYVLLFRCDDFKTYRSVLGYLLSVLHKYKFKNHII